MSVNVKLTVEKSALLLEFIGCQPLLEAFIGILEVTREVPVEVACKEAIIPKKIHVGFEIS